MPTVFHIRGLFILLLILFPISSSGKIADGIKCSECHTMHASQDNMPMGEGGARESLLLLSCYGCHTGENPDSSGRNTPFVTSFSAPAYELTGTESSVETLAGGTFYWSYNDPTAEKTGHNVQPGLEPGSTDPPGGGTMATQLTCSGATGCHGDLSVTNIYKAMSKSHHKADRDSGGNSLIDGLSLGTSYRFLSGVTGLEDPDWELPGAGTGLSSDKHNQYKGSITFNDDPASSDTITSVCARCHGDFHGSGGSPGGTGTGSSPWLRHPTDIDMADSKYNSTEFDNYTTYNPVAPVASATATALVTNDVQTSGNGIVTCVSCHRAHGSRWTYNLRWNYLAWPGGTNAYDGCSICHSSK